MQTSQNSDLNSLACQISQARQSPKRNSIDSSSVFPSKYFQTSIIIKFTFYFLLIPVVKVSQDESRLNVCWWITRLSTKLDCFPWTNIDNETQLWSISGNFTASLFVPYKQTPRQIVDRVIEVVSILLETRF